MASARRVVVGQPATALEIVVPRLAKLPVACAGVNIAMLDVVGKATKAPVFQVLGGPTRAKARALLAVDGESDEELVQAARRGFAAGYRAFQIPIPAAAHANQGKAYVEIVLGRLQTLRQGAPVDADFVLDADGRLSPGDAQMISAAVERFHLLWFNEPCDAGNLSALKRIAAENVTPIGMGRHFHECGAVQDLLREDAVDLLRPDIGQCGISQIRRMAAIAETYYVAVGPTHDGGPIGTAAALHLAAAIPNFFIQQIPWPEAEEDRRMRRELTAAPVEIVKDGFAELPMDPGLGVSVNEQALEKYAEGAL
jgi:galactonate dehydratase